MNKIRYNTFETNSSSTHSLVIPHTAGSDSYELYDSLEHDYEFGRYPFRIVTCYDEKLAYVYYVLYNFKERYDLRDKDKGYGSGIKVGPEQLEAFKDKVNEAYGQVMEEIDYKPYRSEPTPDDIFTLIEDIDEIHKFESGSDCAIVCYKGDYIKIREVNKTDDEDKELTKAWSEHPHKSIIKLDITDKEKRYARIAEILPEYAGWRKASVYVEHTEDFKDNHFIEKLLTADVDFIKRMIFSRDSYIAVGGDEFHGYYIRTIGFEEDYGDMYDDDNEFYSKLEKYEEDNDVYLKGN